MLKIVQTAQEAMCLTEWLAGVELLKDFRVGLTGSFSKGENKGSSTVDIALKLKEGADLDLVGNMDIVQELKGVLESVYKHKFNILFLDLLEKEEELLILEAQKLSIGVNPESVYGSVIDAIRWVEDVATEEEEDAATEEDAEEKGGN